MFSQSMQRSIGPFRMEYGQIVHRILNVKYEKAQHCDQLRRNCEVYNNEKWCLDGGYGPSWKAGTPSWEFRAWRCPPKGLNKSCQRLRINLCEVFGGPVAVTGI